MIARTFRGSQLFGIRRRPYVLLSAATFSGDGTAATYVTHQQQQGQHQQPALAPKNFVATPYRYHAEVKVEVTALSSEGYGVAVDRQHPERTILVPKVWPGETVTVRIFRNNTES